MGIPSISFGFHASECGNACTRVCVVRSIDRSIDGFDGFYRSTDRVFDRLSAASMRLTLVIDESAFNDTSKDIAQGSTRRSKTPRAIDDARARATASQGGCASLVCTPRSSFAMSAMSAQSAQCSVVRFSMRPCGSDDVRWLATRGARVVWVAID